MLFISLFFMIIALARPVLEKGEIRTKSKSIDLMVAIDVSKSMLATDFYPNRLEFAKKEFDILVDNFPEANIGVIAFSSGGFNGYEAIYNQNWEEEGSEYKTRVFYRLKRNFFRTKIDFQGKIIDKKFLWLAGADFYNINTSPVDINHLNDGKSDDDLKYEIHVGANGIIETSVDDENQNE